MALPALSNCCCESFQAGVVKNVYLKEDHRLAKLVRIVSSSHLKRRENLLMNVPNCNLIAETTMKST